MIHDEFFLLDGFILNQCLIEERFSKTLAASDV